MLLFSLPVCGWLLFNAQTWVGQGLAVMGVGIAGLPTLGLLWYHSRSPLWWWSVWGVGGVIVLIGLGILVKTPTGRADPASPIRHRFTQPVSFRPYTLTNIIPESEQVNLGFVVMPYLDPLLTIEQSQRVVPFSRQYYREMENDPHFHQLGSAMGWAYAELLGQPFDVGHYYLYIPQKRLDKPLPAIVFLHGSAGNFKVYSWLWSKLAEEQQMVIIAPSFGFGNWKRRGGTAAVSKALQDAASLVELDEERIYLAGLSNGGLGVSYSAEATPETFRGLIYISPVMPTNVVGQPQFLDKWQNRPVLIITGDADRRIPVSYVSQRAANLKAGGVAVTEIIYPGVDHFLFFSEAEGVLDDISKWLAEVNE